jgi:hypothetical protein
MKHNQLLAEQLYDALGLFISETSRNKEKARLQYYNKTKNLISSIRNHDLHAFPDRKIEDEETLVAIEKIIDALHKSEEIISQPVGHHDIEEIKHALDLYNQVLQQSDIDIRGLRSLLANKIKKASKILADLLSETSRIQIYEEKPVKIINKIQFTTQAPLTPDYLLTDIAPWIKALVDLQIVFNGFQNKENQEIRILSITQKSPPNISINAGAEAIRAIQEDIIPWRRKHAQAMADIEEKNGYYNLELQRAEILEKRAIAEKTRMDARKTYEETRRLKIENDLLAERLCHEIAIKIAKDTLRLTSVEDIELAVQKMLPSIVMLATSDLNIGKTKLSE